MGKLVVSLVGFLSLCALLLLLPSLAAAQCPPAITVQLVWTQDTGGKDKTTFAPGETIQFAALVGSNYGGSGQTSLAITTSFYNDTKTVNIPLGSSTWTWKATAPSIPGNYTVTVQLIDPFCGVWVGRSASFTVSQSSLPSGFSFDVASTTGWLSTSLHVTKGQELSFSAVGSWTVDFRIPNSYVGPDGYSPQVDSTIYQGCKLKLDPPQPYGVLLVRLGYDDPSPIAIGSNAKFPAYRDGFLEFRIHDGDACLADNAGSVTVTVIGADKVTPSKYDAGNYAGKSGFVGVYSYNEPDDLDHVNYCGPGASQVLISAWATTVPDIETLAKQEKTDKSSGTFMADMVSPINNAIGRNYYSVPLAGAKQNDFSNMIGQDILDNHHPLITGIKTQGNGYTLGGWDHAALHIITIYGFDFRSPDIGYIYYYDTAGKIAGEKKGPGPKVQEYNAFWSLVQLNNVQLAGSPK